MTPTTRMHVLRRSREIVSEILTDQEKTTYQILSQLDEVIEGIAQRIEEEAKLALQKKTGPPMSRQQSPMPKRGLSHPVEHPRSSQSVQLDT